MPTQGFLAAGRRRAVHPCPRLGFARRLDGIHSPGLAAELAHALPDAGLIGPVGHAVMP